MLNNVNKISCKLCEGLIKVRPHLLRVKAVDKNWDSNDVGVLDYTYSYHYLCRNIAVEKAQKDRAVAITSLKKPIEHEWVMELAIIGDIKIIT